jgi:HemY protein
MRAALWLLALFAVAVAVALFAGSNPGTVTVFWSPWRVDLSLNLVVVALTALFVVLHLALRTLAALFELPAQARRWRAQQRERAMVAALLDALSHQLAGRFIRARKAAELALEREEALVSSGDQQVHARQLRVLAHLVAAESAQALQDQARRDSHLDRALAVTGGRSPAGLQELREGGRLRAAQWALDDQRAQAALDWLDQLPQGAARRTVALRIKLRAARLAGRNTLALETARLLAKHRAFSPSAAQGIVRGLVADLVAGAHDPDQLQRVWASLEPAERLMPDLATTATQRLLALGGSPQTALDWLLPLWERMVQTPGEWTPEQRSALVRTIDTGQAGLGDVPDRDWLARIESAQRASPRDPVLQYLAGKACMRRSLWGKAQQLLGQASQTLADGRLRRDAWCALARLAEQRGDAAAAAAAWKQAAEPDH